jgi:hypothetical protein
LGIPPNAVKILDGKIVDSKGKPVAVKGLSWFGFNNGATMVDGLWAGGSQAATDFAMIVYELQLLGFNAIRLPFTFDNLELPAKAQDRNCQFTRDEALKSRMLDPLLVESERPALWGRPAGPCRPMQPAAHQVAAGAGQAPPAQHCCAIAGAC